jgi:EAL domain-containing protein (putative c-di-GMP-specific phosphodiesterase class I)
LAVNLSARQMRDPNLYNVIESTLDSLNYPAHLLELEITEGSLLNDDEVVLTLLKKLRRLRIHLPADDFGTGYCRVDYVKRFPFTTLKFDRSFTSDITKNQKDSVILESTFMLSKSLGMEVVAEGVETESQYELLCERGCDLIQGFLFSKLLDVDSFIQYLLQTEDHRKKLKTRES